MKITKTTKRLLSLSFLNVTLSYAHGHRWLEFNDEAELEQTSLAESLEKHNIIANTKIYGSVIDALDYIDFLLKKVGRTDLEDMFNSWNDWGFDYIEVEDWETGTYTDEYFKTRISIFQPKQP